MVASYLEADSRLDGRFAVFDEILFSEPPFGRCAVGHGKSAVAVGQAARDNINPWCDYCCQVF